VSKPSERKKARHLLVQALYQWRMSGNSIIDIEAEFNADNNMAKVDTDYFSEILHAVPSKLDDIQGAYEPFLDRTNEKLDPIATAILQIATYEMLHRIDVPYKVVINEAVSLAKKFGATDSYKYVNGVLDKLATATRSVEVMSTRN
jgi:N utilization substance protein B